MRSDFIIKKEIKKLEDLKGKVPPFTMFGENNIERIEAQIEVLEKKMDEDTVYDKWGEEDEGMICDLLDVIKWMACSEEKDSPSSGWSELVRKK